MATTGALSRHLHFAELNEPLQTSSGWMTPEQRKAAARDNLGVSGMSSDDINVPEITTAGSTVIPAGTLTAALQAIADLADPAA